jgi:hypothetical protein
MSIIRKEIIKLFVNSNTKYTHLNIPGEFEILLHSIPGAECCFIELKSFKFNITIPHNILEGLAIIYKSIK